MIKLSRSSISFWIVLGYLVISLLAIFSSIISSTIVLKTKDSDNEIVDVTLPFYYTMKDLAFLVSETGNISSKWVFQTNTGDEKNRYPKLLNETFEDYKRNLMILSDKSINNHSNKEAISILRETEKLIDAQKKILLDLQSPSDFENSEKLDDVLKFYKINVEDVLPKLNQRYIDWLDKQNIQRTLQIAQEKKTNSFYLLIFVLLVCMVATVTIALYINYKTVKEVVTPVVDLQEGINELGKGKLEKVRLDHRTDEIGQISVAVNKLVDVMKANTEFAQEIGNGNYDLDFNLMSKDDSMGIALIEMRKNLLNQAEKEKKIAWVATGIANFSDILRKEFSEGFYDEIISGIINYTKSNQGGLFILEEIDRKKVLVMKSCYGYERKKFIDKTIDLGEGIAGQCFLEKRTIFVTEIPQYYTHITSGLGHATPSCLLVVPLKLNEEVVGVLELASFKEYESHEREFVEKIAENIASTIISIKVNERTKVLLEESQIQTENLKAQEEEMRQNMEEMQATQEEMARKELENQALLDEMQEKEEMLRDTLQNMALKEEQLRQNLEEMLATQEEMGLKETKLQSLVKEMETKEEQLKKNISEMASKEQQLQEMVKEMHLREDKLKESFDLINDMKEEQSKTHKTQMQEQIISRKNYEKELTTMMDLWNLHLDNIEKILRDKKS